MSKYHLDDEDDFTLDECVRTNRQFSRKRGRDGVAKRASPHAFSRMIQKLAEMGFPAEESTPRKVYGDPNDPKREVYVAESLVDAHRARWKAFTYHEKLSCFSSGVGISFTVVQKLRMRPCKYCVADGSTGITPIVEQRLQARQRVVQSSSSSNPSVLLELMSSDSNPDLTPSPQAREVVPASCDQLLDVKVDSNSSSPRKKIKLSYDCSSTETISHREKSSSCSVSIESNETKFTPKNPNLSFTPVFSGTLALLNRIREEQQRTAAAEALRIQQEQEAYIRDRLGQFQDFNHNSDDFIIDDLFFAQPELSRNVPGRSNSYSSSSAEEADPFIAESNSISRLDEQHVPLTPDAPTNDLTAQMAGVNGPLFSGRFWGEPERQAVALQSPITTTLWA